MKAIRPLQILLISLLTLLFSCEEAEFQSGTVIPYEGPTIPFAIIGDYGLAGEAAKKVSELVHSWDPEFIITTGDNNYPDGALATLEDNIIQYYEDYIYNPDALIYLRCNGRASQEQVNRFFPSLGNHDYDNPIGANPYFAFFTLPGNEQYYDFQRGSAHFFCLESDPILEESCCEHKQAQWLKEKLSQSTAAFKIVYMHHGPYTLSKHLPYQNLRWPFKEWGVDLVVYGHNHVYERFSPNDPANPTYVVNGIGGSPFLSDCSNGSIPKGYSHQCLDGIHGAIRGWITKDELHLELYTVGQSAEAIDAWIIPFIPK